MEYDWNLRLEEMDESDDDLDDKVRYSKVHSANELVFWHLYCTQLCAYFYLTSSLPQPSPIKKDRRPQSFCHSSSLSPHDKLCLPTFPGQRDKPRLSYGMFSNQMYSVSTDCPSSPVSDAPPLPPRNAGKGKAEFRVHQSAYRWCFFFFDYSILSPSSLIPRNGQINRMLRYAPAHTLSWGWQVGSFFPEFATVSTPPL